jgi:hypothetical protein
MNVRMQIFPAAYQTLAPVVASVRQILEEGKIKMNHELHQAHEQNVGRGKMPTDKGKTGMTGEEASKKLATALQGCRSNVINRS